MLLVILGKTHLISNYQNTKHISDTTEIEMATTSAYVTTRFQVLVYSIPIFTVLRIYIITLIFHLTQDPASFLLWYLYFLFYMTFKK